MSSASVSELADASEPIRARCGGRPSRIGRGIRFTVDRAARLVSIGGLALLAGCNSSYGTGPSPYLAAPVPVSPANGVVVTTAPILQPTLTVTNSVATGNVGTVTYRFEVSMTTDFAATVAVGDPIAQGTGTTSYMVTPPLVQVNTTYYWRGRATSGSVTSAFSSTSSFIIPQPGCTVTGPPHVHFDVASASVRGGEDTLALMARSLVDHPTLRLDLDGYTDNIGPLGLNLEISRRRASAVRRVLIERYGVPPERLTVTGYGPAHPLFSNDTPEGRAGNRRVELIER
jgi:outer membrane protein OmpA-like peptidoglycan-associated protein